MRKCLVSETVEIEYCFVRMHYIEKYKIKYGGIKNGRNKEA